MNSDLRKLRFRAWHRGFRELDLLLGTFADVYLDRMSKIEVQEFEKILNLPDQDVYEWITSRTPVPAQYQSAVFTKLQDFCMKDR